MFVLDFVSTTTYPINSTVGRFFAKSPRKCRFHEWFSKSSKLWPYITPTVLDFAVPDPQFQSLNKLTMLLSEPSSERVSPNPISQQHESMSFY